MQPHPTGSQDDLLLCFILCAPFTPLQQVHRRPQSPLHVPGSCFVSFNPVQLIHQRTNPPSVCIPGIGFLPFILLQLQQEGSQVRGVPENQPQRSGERLPRALHANVKRQLTRVWGARWLPCTVLLPSVLPCCRNPPGLPPLQAPAPQDGGYTVAIPLCPMPILQVFSPGSARPSQ